MGCTEVERLLHVFSEAGAEPPTDEGRVSIEKLLWYLAAAIAVGVIAWILWAQVTNAG